jgi:transcriptional regulator with XRE-family HTH domain
MAMEGFGQRVRALREARGLEQDVLAAQIGLTPTAISKIENGGREVKVDEALAMAKVLQVDIASFLGEAYGVQHFAHLSWIAQRLAPSCRKEFAVLLRVLADNLEALPLVPPCDDAPAR